LPASVQTVTQPNHVPLILKTHDDNLKTTERKKVALVDIFEIITYIKEAGAYTHRFNQDETRNIIGLDLWMRW
jgi:hypothetical protein